MGDGCTRWGYREHITTKSRHYSTTMGALPPRIATWTRTQGVKHVEHQGDTRPNGRNAPVTGCQPTSRLTRCSGSSTTPDTPARGAHPVHCGPQRIHTRRVGLVEARRQVRDQHGDPPGDIMADGSRTAQPRSQWDGRINAPTMSEEVLVVVPESYRLPHEANRALVRVILAVRDRMLDQTGEQHEPEVRLLWPSEYRRRSKIRRRAAAGRNGVPWT